MHTFFSTHEVNAGTLELDKTSLHHLEKVLRIKNGEKIKIATPAGKLYLVTYHNKIFTIAEELTPPPAPLPYHLYMGLLKGEMCEWVLEKAVELNATSLTWVISKNTVAREIKPNKWERLLNLASESQKQCGRLQPLKINAPQVLEKLVNLSTEGVNIVLNETETGLSLEQALNENKPPYHLWIGPEGGWDKTELLLMKTQGFISTQAGGLMLRAETCAMYAASLAQGKLT
ncbi:16S rRNA (uracil(1498)-N(3))-methyltransferase [bacterium]|nr:16S rRNA (uracil(1498)-N(3))-methyltransferase [bacterium]